MKIVTAKIKHKNKLRKEAKTEVNSQKQKRCLFKTASACKCATSCVPRFHLSQSEYLKNIGIKSSTNVLLAAMYFNVNTPTNFRIKISDI